MGAHLTRLLLLLAVGLAHFNTLGNSFHFDDEHSLTENPHIRDLGNIPAFFVRTDMFSRNVGSDMYRPLVLVSYALNYRVGGFEVRGYDVVNLLLHVLVTWLVYGLLVSIGGSGYGGLFAPALFGVHPLTAEPVNYISSRSESMAALFALLSFYLYARSSRGRPSLLSLSAFAGALLSKSAAVCLPLALILYEISQRGEGGRGGGVYGVASGRSGCALVYVAGSSALIRRGDDGERLRSWTDQANMLVNER